MGNPPEHGAYVMLGFCPLRRYGCRRGRGSCSKAKLAERLRTNLEERLRNVLASIMPMLPDPAKPPVYSIWQKTRPRYRENDPSQVIPLDGCCEKDSCLTVTQQALIAGFYGAV